MILGTFREMPGLCLHLNQAARLFGLPRGTCEVILEDLVTQGKLRHAADGQFVSGQMERQVPPAVTRAARVQGPFRRDH
jgi:hypothetical protein